MVKFSPNIVLSSLFKKRDFPFTDFRKRSESEKVRFPTGGAAGLLLLTSMLSAILGAATLINRRKRKSKRQTFQELYEDNDLES